MTYPANITDGTGDVRLAGNVNFTDATTAPVVGLAGAVKVTAVAAPADAALAAGQAFIWLDATDGAGKLMVKAKTANGTVATGSVTLT